MNNRWKVSPLGAYQNPVICCTIIPVALPPLPMGQGKSDEVNPMAENREWKLTEKEEKLLAMLREIRFGEVVIHVADGQPVRAEEVRKSIKF